MVVMGPEFIFLAVTDRHTAVDMAQEFPRLVHSPCTSSAPALEMHSAQVLEMLVQMQCPRSVQVLQEMLRIQEGVTEQLCNTVVSKKCPSR